MTSPLVTEGAIHVVGRVPPLLAVASLPSGLTGALSGVVGLLIGSFLNVVIYRVPRGLSVVEPRSFCPHCDAPLRSLDNVPLLSWMVLR
ncbi:MAG: prepilin peptidase, partial [Acidimicrobiales bacterium]